MIRHVHGSDFLLITQDAHARLAGELAAHLGNDFLAVSTPHQPVIDAIAMHDCGWPLHDDCPTLNPAGLPLHVFETPLSITTRVWRESARRAAEADPNTGLLVSLHVLTLSAMVQMPDAETMPDSDRRQDLFLWNQFQQDQIELQDNLRRTLRLRTDIPLRLGLAGPQIAVADERESWLAFNYGMLRLMDRLSLELCCSEALPWRIDPISPRPGAEPVEIRITRTGARQVEVEPWLFSVEQLEFQVPFRRVSVTPFSDEEGFRAVFERISEEQLTVRVRRKD